ncbi:hypothetical protein BG011_005151 [Mortierella polycephala]|uniref:FAD-binding domain-containing protein n=1 Tax=Mortierella polycephala TaxID=41804 RepID=A0A9P6U1Q2_9FUNG|nr:hypothetical protein BG011_005151 [Mortierella polycephala]
MEQSNTKTTTVLIVGAGLGGLMMGALLERTGINYCIFERAVKVKPLGSVMALGANILPVFEQLGLLDELHKISLPVPSMEIYDADLNLKGSMKLGKHKDISGYKSIVFARPDLYELMLKQVPPQKIMMGKRVLRTEEKDDHVFIYCSDNSTYQGDILIGADGAYSGVRQNLYKHLDTKGLLPKSDLGDFTIASTLATGVAKPADPDKYPQLKDPFVHFSSVMGGGRRVWSSVNVPGNQICWTLIYQFKDYAEAKEQHFRNSEWAPEMNEAMLKEYYNDPCPYGGIMGDLIDATPKDLVSKVFVEEKLFETWFHGRTVLIGDACHKILPGAGQGAVNAMQDAVILANCLYELADATPKSVTTAFQDYYNQRYPHAKAVLKYSQFISNTMNGQNWRERALRHILLNYIPEWVQNRNYAKQAEYRPQAAFLPLVENRGTGHVLPQKASRRYAEELKKRAIPV